MLINYFQRSRFKKVTHHRYLDLASEVILVRPSKTERGTSETTLVRGYISGGDPWPKPKKVEIELETGDHGIWTYETLTGKLSGRSLPVRRHEDSRKMTFDLKDRNSVLLVWQGSGEAGPITESLVHVLCDILEMAL